MLSFITKLSTGYWDIFDPTNGYTAIHARVLRLLRTERIARRYFFESDVLFQLGLVRARVRDVPMHARYGSESSNLRVSKIIFGFSWRHVSNFVKRIFYNYFLRDFSAASAQLLLGTVLLLFGTVFGAVSWINVFRTQEPAHTGTIMLAVLPIILGMQLLLSFLAYDVARIPREAIHPTLDPRLLLDDEPAE